MTNFDELSIEDLNHSSFEGNRLQYFLESVANEIEHLKPGQKLSILVDSTGPWQALEGFHEGGWKYVPVVPISTDDCYGHIVWEGIGFPNFMNLSDSLHRHFRNSL